MGLCLPPPGGQQAVALLVTLGAPPGGEVAQPPSVDDLEPVFATGVEHVEVKVHRAADLPKQLYVQRRHRGQRENVGAGWQPRLGRRVRADRLQCLAKCNRRMQGTQAQLARDAPPEGGLPALVGEHGFVLRVQFGKLHLQPRLEPVGPVGDVLLKQARNPARELVAHHIVRARKVRRQARVRGHELGVTKGCENPPGQCHRGERRLFGNRGHQAADLLPEPVCEKTELHVGADPGMVGNRQGQRATHGRAWHDELVRGEDAATALAQTVNQQPCQRLVAIGKMDVQHATSQGTTAIGLDGRSRLVR